MTFFATCARQVIVDPEWRPEHSTQPGTVITPTGGLVASSDPGIQAATTRAVLDLYDEARRTT